MATVQEHSLTSSEESTTEETLLGKRSYYLVEHGGVNTSEAIPIHARGSTSQGFSR